MKHRDLPDRLNINLTDARWGSGHQAQRRGLTKGRCEADQTSLAQKPNGLVHSARASSQALEQTDLDHAERLRFCTLSF
ncbi:hypothetical protein D9M68_713830 [compost metagenome]